MFTQLLDHYLRLERPQTSTDALFVSLKGPARGAQPIDLMHVDAARRYRARLAGPADFRGRSSLSRGVAVSVRAFRQKTPKPEDQCGGDRVSFRYHLLQVVRAAGLPGVS